LGCNYHHPQNSLTPKSWVCANCSGKMICFWVIRLSRSLPFILLALSLLHILTKRQLRFRSRLYDFRFWFEDLVEMKEDEINNNERRTIKEILFLISWILGFFNYLMMFYYCSSCEEMESKPCCWRWSVVFFLSNVLLLLCLNCFFNKFVKKKSGFMMNTMSL